MIIALNVFKTRRFYVASICFSFFLSGAVLSDVYEINRTFTPISYEVGNPTGVKIREGVLNLTGIVQVDPVQLVSNNVHEFEGVGIGFDTRDDAWRAAVTNRAYRLSAAEQPAENAGMISLVRPNPYDGWNVYLHSIQNALYFFPATNHDYIFPEGNTGQISRVLVGSLGDWVMPDPLWYEWDSDPSYPLAAHVGPHVDWLELENLPMNIDKTAVADLNTYYSLMPQFILEINDADCDKDGIPDYADGYNRDAVDDNEDDECPCRKVTLWRVTIPEYMSLECCRIKFDFQYSDPNRVQFADGVYSVGPGMLRLWRKDDAGTRYSITNGLYFAADLGITETCRSIDLEIEAVNRNLWLADWDFWPFFYMEPDIGVSIWGEGSASCSNALYWANPNLYYNQTVNQDPNFFPGSYAQADLIALIPRMVPDWNHDRVINSLDENKVDILTPYRFWINDDDDEGDISEGDNDVPGQGSFFDNANCDDSVVNGRCDLLDFFPLWLDLKSTLDLFPLENGYEYRLRHEDEALRFVYTDLVKYNAGNFLIADTNAFGRNFEQFAHVAETILVTDDGVILDSNFLNRIANEETKGVIILEGIEETTKPLILEIKIDDRLVFKTELSVSTSGVEDMYRWINVRAAANGEVTDSTNTTEPNNFPDSFSNGKNFIFVHGYSVHEEAARSWNAEIFKRLYQSGSRAKYTGVTWYGNEGQISDWVPFGFGGKTPDYYSNVENAFQTAEVLASEIQARLSGVKHIAAHSLGNMMVSSAIKDHGLSADTYFMLNAAVAMEAYDGEVSHRNLMRHPNWQTYTNHNLWASEWHNLFASSSGDSRNKLTWRDYFGPMSNGLNFYSSTEDVLENGDGHLPDVDLNDPLRSWVNQETRKGTTLIWLGPGNAEAGWGINNDYVDLSITEINALPNATVRDNSFFLHFDDEQIYGIAGSDYLLDGHSNVRDSKIYRRLIADAIPALSNPSGRNTLGRAVYGNEDYMEYKRGAYPDDWPRESNAWWHSDIKNVAYPYNYSFFDKLVIDGSLK